MPDDHPSIPPDLAERLAKLDLSNPKDLEKLFALEAELSSVAGLEPEALPAATPPSEPEEPPTPAYLAAADPLFPLDEFIEVVGNDPRQLINHQSLLFPACLTGSLEKVVWLLAQGLDPNHADQHGYTPLIYASLPGRTAKLDLLKLLIDQGADLNAQSSHNESPLRILTREGNYAACRLLLSAGADNAPFPPLHQAAAEGDLPTLLSLLTPDSIESKDSWDRSPWLTAIHADQVQAAELLQSQGADIKAVGHTGDSALHLAAEGNACNAITWLLAQGHDLEARAAFSNTPLHNAVESDSLEATKLLLSSGADVHALTESADAPISFADSVPVLELLHAHGANLNQPSSEGRFPLQNFADCNDLEGLQWLLSHGANLTLLPEDDRTLIRSLLTT